MGTVKERVKVNKISFADYNTGKVYMMDDFSSANNFVHDTAMDMYYRNPKGSKSTKFKVDVEYENGADLGYEYFVDVMEYFKSKPVEWRLNKEIFAKDSIDNLEGFSIENKSAKQIFGDDAIPEVRNINEYFDMLQEINPSEKSLEGDYRRTFEEKVSLDNSAKSFKGVDMGFINKAYNKGVAKNTILNALERLSFKSFRGDKEYSKNLVSRFYEKKRKKNNSKDIGISF